MVCIFCLIFTLITLSRINDPLDNLSIFPNTPGTLDNGELWWRVTADIGTTNLSRSQISENQKITNRQDHKIWAPSHLATIGPNNALGAQDSYLGNLIWGSRAPVFVLLSSINIKVGKLLKSPFTFLVGGVYVSNISRYISLLEIGMSSLSLSGDNIE